MAKKQNLQRGAIIRTSDFVWHSVNGCSLAYPVSRDNGADAITCVVVDIPAGQSWTPNATLIAQEMIAVVFQGNGLLSVNEKQAALQQASAFYAPAGTPALVQADSEHLVLYLKFSELPTGTAISSSQVQISSLWNDTTVFRGFEGYQEASSTAGQGFTPANMNFIIWPGTGSSHLCLHCGIQGTQQAFGVHVHPYAEELFMAFEGQGQGHLDGQWIDMSPGDILYAPPGIYHGARNPGKARFVTCGGPTPFDPVLYELAGVIEKS